MNIKKFISAASALTIAASAFAGLAVTASAATTTLYERGAGTAWSDADLSTWTQTGTTTASIDSTYGLYTTNNANSDGYLTQTITPTANSIITVDATWVGASNTGRTFAQGCASYFAFGNILIGQNDQSQQTGYTLDGNIANVTTFTGPNGYRGTWPDGYANDFVIHMEINTATNTLTLLTVKSSDDLDTNLLKVENTVLANPDYTTITTGFKRGGRRTTTHYEGLKSIKVTEETQSVSTAAYTVKKVLADGTVLEEDNSNSTVVGETPTLITSVFENETGKYRYVSDDSATVGGVAADGTTVYTMLYEAVPTYTATVNAVVDGSSIGTFTNSGYEGDTVRVYYPKYIEQNGVYYTTDANASYPSYAVNFTEGTSSDVTYAVSTVTYAAEIENLAASHSYAADGLVPERYSNGSAKRLYQDSYITISDWVAASDMEVTVALWSRNNSSSSAGAVSVYTVDAEGNLTDTGVDLGEWTTGECSEKTATVNVPEGCTIAIYNDTEHNSNLEMDYVALTATPVVEPDPEPTIPEPVKATGKDVTGAPANDPASLWTSVVSTNGYSMKKASATVVLKSPVNGVKERTESFDATTAFSGTATFYVVVNQNTENIESVTVTVE